MKEDYFVNYWKMLISCSAYFAILLLFHYGKPLTFSFENMFHEITGYALLWGYTMIWAVGICAVLLLFVSLTLVPIGSYILQSWRFGRLIYWATVGLICILLIVFVFNKNGGYVYLGAVLIAAFVTYNSFSAAGKTKT